MRVHEPRITPLASTHPELLPPGFGFMIEVPHGRLVFGPGLVVNGTPTVRVPIGGSRFALVDLELLPRIVGHNWIASVSRTPNLVYASTYGKGGQSMHRLVLGLRSGDGMVGDHGNHVTLDNRIENLSKSRGTASNAANTLEQFCTLRWEDIGVADTLIHRLLFAGELSASVAEILTHPFGDADDELLFQRFALVRRLRMPRWDPVEGCGVLRLQDGHEVKVDRDTYLIARQSSWRHVPATTNSGASIRATIGGRTINLAHLALCHPSAGNVVDHKYSIFDCRRQSLSVQCRRGNAKNRIKRKPTSSAFDNVSRRDGVWAARSIAKPGGRASFARYKDERHAALHADWYVRQAQRAGENLFDTRLNFPGIVMTPEQIAAKAEKPARRRPSTSKYVGVCFSRRKLQKPWRAHLTVDGRFRHLGCYATEEGARQARDKAVRALGRERPRLNKPDRPCVAYARLMSMPIELVRELSTRETRHRLPGGRPTRKPKGRNAADMGVLPFDDSLGRGD